jgi:hypothetical protein
MAELRKQWDATLAASQRTGADLTALRNVNQRLMVENSRLLDAADRAGPAFTSGVGVDSISSGH